MEEAPWKRRGGRGAVEGRLQKGCGRAAQLRAHLIDADAVADGDGRVVQRPGTEVEGVLGAQLHGPRVVAAAAEQLGELIPDAQLDEERGKVEEHELVERAAHPPPVEKGRVEDEAAQNTCSTRRVRSGVEGAVGEGLWKKELWEGLWTGGKLCESVSGRV